MSYTPDPLPVPQESQVGLETAPPHSECSAVDGCKAPAALDRPQPLLTCRLHHLYELCTFPMLLSAHLKAGSSNLARVFVCLILVLLFG